MYIATGLYTQNGLRYSLGLPGRTPSGSDAKMNDLHSPKHKQGEVDRECKYTSIMDLSVHSHQIHSQQIYWYSEDLQFPPSLQGPTRLQKKLEEGVPEHHDMIFRETFGHFADLMTSRLVRSLRLKLSYFPELSLSKNFHR